MGIPETREAETELSSTLDLRKGHGELHVTKVYLKNNPTVYSDRGISVSIRICGCTRQPAGPETKYKRTEKTLKWIASSDRLLNDRNAFG